MKPEHDLTVSKIMIHFVEVSVTDRFVIPLRVYYADTDSAGIVYYGTYMRWMELGRCEFFSHYGFDLSAKQEEGVILVVARATLNYQRPARLGQYLNMVIWVTEVSGFSFKFNYQFLHHQEGAAETPLVDAQTMMVSVGTHDFKLQPIPEPAATMLKQVAE